MDETQREHEVERPLRPSPEPPLERRDQQRIDAEAQQEGSDGGSEHANRPGQVQEHDRREGQIAADREELPVGDVDDVEDAEDQAEAHREERVEPAQDEPLDQELEEGLEHQPGLSSPR